MITFLCFYASGALLALYFYQKWFEYSISYAEIAITWFYQLPVMVIEKQKKDKYIQEENEKFATFWSAEFFKAYKISKEEGWNEADWKRWNDQMEYVKQFIL